MNSKVTIIALFCIVGLATVFAGDHEYFWLRECDDRCDLTARMNPFTPGCHDCCRMRGFSKGKCKGFGWKYCMCKQTFGNHLLNTILQG